MTKPIIKIRIARGPKANLPVPPNSFEEGRPYFCTDTRELFIGAGTNQDMIAAAGDADDDSAYATHSEVSSGDAATLASAEHYTDLETARAIAAESLLQPLSEKDQPNGYPSLDSNGKVPLSELPPVGGGAPNLSDYHHVSDATDQISIKGTAGTFYGLSLSSAAAGKVYVKLHDVAGNPVPGQAVWKTYGVQAGLDRHVFIDGGIDFLNGLGLTIVTGIANADSSHVLAGDVDVEVYYL